MIGTVVRVYTHESTGRNYKTTLCLAEVAVEEVVKGEAIQPSDRVYVKYFHRKWIGDGPMPTGWNGRKGYPEGSRIKAYLSGSPAKGFGRIEPNGLVLIPNLVELNDNDKVILDRRFRELCFKTRNTHFNTLIESNETKRVLVVRWLLPLIESELSQLEISGKVEIEKVTNKIKDLDRLDDEKHREEIEGFRKRLAKLSSTGG